MFEDVERWSVAEMLADMRVDSLSSYTVYEVPITILARTKRRRRQSNVGNERTTLSPVSYNWIEKRTVPMY